MVTRKKNESENNYRTRIAIEAYQIVMHDLDQDIGWKPRFKRKLLLALGQRMWELENVWYDYDDVVVDSPAVKQAKSKK